jgi:hypothetical protein
MDSLVAIVIRSRMSGGGEFQGAPAMVKHGYPKLVLELASALRYGTLGQAQAFGGYWRSSCGWVGAAWVNGSIQRGLAEVRRAWEPLGARGAARRGGRMLVRGMEGNWIGREKGAELALRPKDYCNFHCWSTVPLAGYSSGFVPT